MPGCCRGFIAAIGEAAHGERIGKTGEAEPQAALGARLMRLCWQGIVRDVDDIVHEAHGAWHDVLDRRLVKARFVRKRIKYQARQIDRTEKARAIGRQWLFAARIGRMDRFAIGEVVLAIDAIDEDHARARHNHRSSA